MNPKRIGIGLAVALVCFSVALAQDGPAPQATPWYPLAKGNAWYYRSVLVDAPRDKRGDKPKDNSTDPSKQVVLRVKDLIYFDIPKADKTVKQPAYRLEGKSEDRELVEHIAVLADGIYRYAGDKDITAPLRILKLPPNKGDSWQSDIPLESGNVTGTFTNLGEEKVTVPAGTFDAYHVSGEFTIGTVGATSMTADYWFCSGKGIVKQKIKRGTFTVQLELEKFEQGK